MVTIIALTLIALIAVFLTVKSLQRLYMIQKIIKKAIDQISVADAFDQIKAAQNEIPIWYVMGGFLLPVIIIAVTPLLELTVFYLSLFVFLLLVNAVLLSFHIKRCPFQTIWRKYYRTKEN